MLDLGFLKQGKYSPLSSSFGWVCLKNDLWDLLAKLLTSTFQLEHDSVFRWTWKHGPSDVRGADCSEEKTAIFSHPPHSLGYTPCLDMWEKQYLLLSFQSECGIPAPFSTRKQPNHSNHSFPSSTVKRNKISSFLILILAAHRSCWYHDYFSVGYKTFIYISYIQIRTWVFFLGQIQFSVTVSSEFSMNCI